MVSWSRPAKAKVPLVVSLIRTPLPLKPNKHWRVPFLVKWSTIWDMTVRQKAVFECLRAQHAQDLLLAIRIDELGQHMSPLQYRTILSWKEHAVSGSVPQEEHSPLEGLRDSKEPDNNGSEVQNADQMDHVSGVNDCDLDVEEDYYEDEYSIQNMLASKDMLFMLPENLILTLGLHKMDLNILGESACPEHLMPRKEWEDVFVADFSKLRLVSLSFDRFFGWLYRKYIGPKSFIDTIYDAPKIERGSDFMESRDAPTSTDDFLLDKKVIEQSMIATMTPPIEMPKNMRLFHHFIAPLRKISFIHEEKISCFPPLA
ncbi:putative reverse transcriptase domain-containing protein [Tanacetum coccineum]